MLGWTGNVARDQSVLCEDQSGLPTDQSNMAADDAAAAAAGEDPGAGPRSERCLPVALSPPPAPSVRPFTRVKRETEGERAAEQMTNAQMHVNVLDTIGVGSEIGSDPSRNLVVPVRDECVTELVAVAAASAPQDTPQVNAVRTVVSEDSELLSSLKTETKIQTPLTQPLSRTDITKSRVSHKSPSYGTDVPLIHRHAAQWERETRDEQGSGVSTSAGPKQGERQVHTGRKQRLEQLATPGQPSSSQHHSHYLMHQTSFSLFDYLRMMFSALLLRCDYSMLCMLSRSAMCLGSIRKTKRTSQRRASQKGGAGKYFNVFKCVLCFQCIFMSVSVSVSVSVCMSVAVCLSCSFSLCCT